MTEKAESIIKDAFFELQVLQDEAPLEGSDKRTAIRKLNRMMASLAADGIVLGYTAIDNIADPMTVPDGALGPIVSNLAIALSPDYLSVPPSPQLVSLAEKGMQTLIQLGVNIPQVEYPDTLPRGSGNYHSRSTDNTFYPGEDEDQILSESNGNILLEDDTEEA